MDETIGVGVGPAERAHHAGGDGPTPEPRRRMSARRKQETVLRLLRGEDLELVSRELGVTAAELSGWRDQFLAGGEASLKSRPADARDAEIDRLQAKVGELTMTAELLEAKIEFSPFINLLRMSMKSLNIKIILKLEHKHLEEKDLTHIPNLAQSFQIKWIRYIIK